MESTCNTTKCTESERMTRMEDKIEKIYEIIVDIRVSQAKLESVRGDIDENKATISKVRKQVEDIKIDNEVMKRMATKREVYLSYAIAVLSIMFSLLPHVVTWVQKNEVTNSNLPSQRMSGSDRP